MPFLRPSFCRSRRRTTPSEQGRDCGWQSKSAWAFRDLTCEQRYRQATEGIKHKRTRTGGGYRKSGGIIQIGAGRPLLQTSLYSGAIRSTAILRLLAPKNQTDNMQRMKHPLPPAPP